MRPIAVTRAHGAAGPDGLWTSWTFDPLVVVGLVAAAWLYARGVRRLWGGGRGRGVGPRQVAAFYAGLASIALALVSPIEGLAGSLVSGHMAQHLLLLVPAPALLVYASPGLVLSAGLPDSARRAASSLRKPSGAPRRIAAVLTAAGAAVSLHVATMWIWHLPGPYGAAVVDDGLHAFEHASFLGTALLFWSLVVRPRGRPRRAYPVALVGVLVVWMLSGGLGALLTFSATPLYPELAHHAAEWGMSALSDQQLAGAVMWVPAGFAYLVTMAVLFVRWMDSLERGPRRPARTGEGRPAEAPR